MPQMTVEVVEMMMVMKLSINNFKEERRNFLILSISNSVFLIIISGADVMTCHLCIYFILFY